MHDAPTTTKAPTTQTGNTCLTATIRTRSPVAAYANTVHREVPVVTDGSGFSDLVSGGRRFRYSHTERLLAPTGHLNERLVYDDIGPLPSSPPSDWLPPGGTPLGAVLRLAQPATPARAA